MSRSAIPILLHSGSKIDEIIIFYIRGLMMDLLLDVPDEVVARHGEIGWLSRRHGCDYQRLPSIWDALDSVAGEGNPKIWYRVRAQREEVGA